LHFIPSSITPNGLLEDKVIRRGSGSPREI
jgi:hypothetical protein